MKTLKIFLSVVLAFLVMGLPLWTGGLAYYIAVTRGAAHPLRAAAITGLAILAALPIWLVGHALAESAKYKQNAKPLPETAIITSPPVLPAMITSPPNVQYPQLIDIWKTSVEVQQHFNGLELQIRNFAVTLLVAVLGATAFALKEHYVITVFSISMSLGAGVCLAGIPGWLGFYFMDRYWYHQLLIGSVQQAMVIEKKLKDSIPEMGLTKAIGDASPWTVGPFEIHSSEKIDIFYSVGLAILIALTCLLLLLGSGNIEPPNRDIGKGSAVAAPVVVKDMKTAPQGREKQLTPSNQPPASSSKQEEAGRK